MPELEVDEGREVTGQGRGSMREREPEPTLISVQGLVHATEDEDKVLAAIRQLFPPESRDALQLERRRLRGYFHNPIVMLVAKLRRRKLIGQTLHYLGSLLPEQDREWLRRRLALHYDDKGNLYMRFDKQESYRGRLRLVERGDSLRLVIKLTGGIMSQEALLGMCQRLGLL